MNESCPFLDEINRQCKATFIYPASIYSNTVSHGNITLDEMQKCKTIWESCPTYLQQLKATERR